MSNLDIGFAGPGSSVGCRSAWHADSRRFNLQVQQQTFVKIWSWNNFYGHSRPTADSSRTVVSYWQKNVHLVLVKHLGSLPRNSVVRLTDRLNMTIVVDWDVKPQIKQTKEISSAQKKLTSLSSQFATRQDSNRPAQPQRLAIVLKFST